MIPLKDLHLFDNIRDNNTLLHHAIKINRIDLALILLNHPDCKKWLKTLNKYGNTPLSMCVLYQQWEFAQKLSELDEDKDLDFLYYSSSSKNK